MRQLSDREYKVVEFITEQHGLQRRKYSGEPYVEHCIEVAELVYKYTESEMFWIIAMCHDLLEDTECTRYTLRSFLLTLGFQDIALSNQIVSGVIDLTDEYTSENYPDKNREERKKAEAKHIGTKVHYIHTIKYADIISNTRSIVAYDSKFALTYLPEKVQLLHYMRKGDINLYIQACAEVYEGLRSLGLLENYKFSV